MRLSAYSDYAFRVLMQAAMRMPQRITVDQVAETFGISRHHLVKVVHDLGRSGYLQRTVGWAVDSRLPDHPTKSESATSSAWAREAKPS